MTAPITVTLPACDWQAIVAAMRHSQEDLAEGLQADDAYYHQAETAATFNEWDRLAALLSGIVDCFEGDLGAAA